MVDFPELAAIRLGYGLSPRFDPPADAAAVLASVAATAARAPAVTTAQSMAQELRAGELRKAAKKTKAANDGDRGPFKPFRRELYGQIGQFIGYRLAHAAGAPVGFGERLVQFWANHFTTRISRLERRALVMAQIDEAIRPRIGASFGQLLRAAVTHPAMLIYLNQDQSVGPDSPAARRPNAKDRGLNENLARELMELHTLGVGAPYTQADVRALANLLTGLSYSPKDAAIFYPARAEPGAETVLGKTYGGRKAAVEDIHALLDDLALHPATARHISAKLAAHFVADDPDPALVAALAAEWTASRGDLMRVYAVLVGHPALAAQFRQKVRQPFDFIAAGMRALGLSTEDVLALKNKQLAERVRGPLERMGQDVTAAPGPDGWPEAAAAWVQPQQLAERIDWAMAAPERLVAQLPDPRAFMQAALGSTATEGTVWAVPKAESIREGVGIVLASADFNRR